MIANYFKYAKTILVVEEDTTLRTIICRQLSYAGYRVVGVSSAALATSLVCKYGLPHLAIVGAILSDVSGCELCQHIRADGYLPVMMLMDGNNGETHVCELNDVADDCMTKPLDVHVLLQRVDRLLERPSAPEVRQKHSMFRPWRKSLRQQPGPQEHNDIPPPAPSGALTLPLGLSGIGLPALSTQGV